MQLQRLVVALSSISHMLVRMMLISMLHHCTWNILQSGSPHQGNGLPQAAEVKLHALHLGSCANAWHLFALPHMREHALWHVHVGAD